LIEGSNKAKRNIVKNVEWEKIKNKVERHEKRFDILKSFSIDKKFKIKEEEINFSFKY
jgi:hypothetical protein